MFEDELGTATDSSQGEFGGIGLGWAVVIDDDVPGQVEIVGCLDRDATRLWVDPARDGIERWMRRRLEAGEPRTIIRFLKGGTTPKGESGPILSQDLKSKVDVAPGLEAGVDLEDLRHGFNIVAGDAERGPKSFGGEGGNARPLLGGHFSHGVLAALLAHD